jgi:GNAT superfamily N-acetyltransferase
MDDFVIVKEHKDMLLYIDSLQKKNAEYLSFYPKQAFEREQKNGRLFLGLLNGEPCGYIYVGAGGGDVKCHQVCIQYDARRKLYGAMLVVALEDYAKQSHSDSITLRCGFDLEANNFWKEMGYNCIAVKNGGVRRMRKINVWRKYLKPQLFEPQWVEPVKGKVNSTLWRKHKDTGLITQFTRGEKLDQYRIMLINKENKSE